MSIKIEKQSKFPYLKEYRDKFPITDETIFVFKDKIYTNNEMPYDILAHELYHIAQGNLVGWEKWIKSYLNDTGFRLACELSAYVHQLREVQKMGDKKELAAIKMECATNLSSPLYGNVISYADAIKYFNKKL